MTDAEKIRVLREALKPLVFSQEDNPPPGVALEHWRAAVLDARNIFSTTEPAPRDSSAPGETDNGWWTIDSVPKEPKDDKFQFVLLTAPIFDTGGWVSPCFDWWLPAISACIPAQWARWREPYPPTHWRWPLEYPVTAPQPAAGEGGAE